MPDPALPFGESLTVEFKSDLDRLPDHELVQTVVCLANADGGTIYLGVEDDGRVSGLHPLHQDPTGLAALVSNRTVPPVSVRVRTEADGELRYLSIEVPRSDRLVATSDGTLLRRRLKADGTPECTPFYPHEWPRRAADLGQLDYSALPMPEVGPEELDPLERVRLRQAIERYGGNRALLGLSDDELDGALGLVRREGDGKLVTVAGLLLLGRSEALRRHIPTHEVAFQVLDGTEVAVNEFLRDPLVRTFDRVQDLFGARVTEAEIQVGLFRVPIPTFDRRSFREAFINAVTHRDYTRLGATHCRWETDAISISNPGGFVDGVTLDNLLVVEPRPRNPTLADAFKRIGLAERTGRGVDLIYQGLLRYGRLPPDYGRSDRHTVVVRLPGGEADRAMLRLIIREEERIGGPLPVDTLLALHLLRRERRIGVRTVAEAIQGDDARARQVLERLVEAGLVAAYGEGKARSYTLSAQVYRQMGEAAGYVRQAVFDRLQQEQMVLKYVAAHGRITRREAVELCQIRSEPARRLLERLAAEGQLKLVGERRGAFYEAPGNV